MSNTHNSSKGGINTLLLFAVAGLAIAGAVFLFVFITSQKASTFSPPIKLKITIPSPPSKPKLPELIRPSIIPDADNSQSATPSAPASQTPNPIQNPESATVTPTL